MKPLPAGVRLLAAGLLVSFCLAGSAAAQQPVGVAEPARADSTFPKAPLSPGGAFFRSLAIPGWAQAELDSEVRGAFYFLAEATSLWMLARTQSRLSHAQRTLAEDAPLVESRKQQREDWIVMAVFWAFFSAADAWVSVQLYGFEERTETGAVSYRVGFEIPF